uniref:Uncharacterized protein n=1 Tax=Anguilla anguilla TaxID=7936 RepID=A0A0E9U309_ANGAN
MVVIFGGSGITPSTLRQCPK